MKLKLLLPILLVAVTARAEVLDRIAAVVNGRPITLSEVAERVAPELGRVPAGPAGSGQRKELLKQGLDQLIDEHLVASEAQSLGIEITDDEVQHLVEQLAKQNNMDAAQFKEALAQQGVSIDTVKDSLRRQQLMIRLLQYKVKPRRVSDEEVQQVYASRNRDAEYEVRTRDIYIAVPENAAPAVKEAAKAKADQAIQRLKEGQSFAIVARDLSEGPSAHEGGDLGFIRHGQMIAAIDQAAFALQPGQNSGLVQVPGGYHIVMVEDRRKIEAKPLPQVMEQLRAELANDSVMKEREHYLTQLRKTAQVEEKL